MAETGVVAVAAKPSTSAKKWGPEEMWQQQMMMMQQFMMGAWGASQNPEMQWKMKFHEALKKSGISDKPEYTAADAGGGSFTGMVTVQGQTHSADEPTKNKKASEQSAAKAGLKAMFPEAFEKISSESDSSGGGDWMFPGMMGMGAVGKGQKRKNPFPDQPVHPKSKLQHALSIFILNKAGRPVNKDDVQYTITEIEGPPKMYQATCVIAEYESGKEIKGEAGKSKSEAEANAAKAAYDEIESTVAPMIEEHNAKKKLKKQESLAELKKTHAAKKEAQKAEKEANATPAITDSA